MSPRPHVPDPFHAAADRRVRSAEWASAPSGTDATTTRQALLPAHPAGLIELTDAELGSIEGGVMTNGLGGYTKVCPVSGHC
jgi:mersacidin/lichenicidin family type 2 lantibiotic